MIIIDPDRPYQDETRVVLVVPNSRVARRFVVSLPYCDSLPVPIAKMAGEEHGVAMTVRNVPKDLDPDEEVRFIVDAVTNAYRRFGPTSIPAEFEVVDTLVFLDLRDPDIWP